MIQTKSIAIKKEIPFNSSLLKKRENGEAENDSKRTSKGPSLETKKKIKA